MNKPSNMKFPVTIRRTVPKRLRSFENKILFVPGTTASIILVSEELKLIICPLGVLSKKLIFLFIIFLISSLYIRWALKEKFFDHTKPLIKIKTIVTSVIRR